MDMQTEYKITMVNAINGMSMLCHKAALDAGWYEGINPYDKYFVGTRFSLIHSEISEAFEGFRRNRPDDHLPERKNYEVELADALIRIFDFAGSHGLDLGGALRDKMAYNAIREDHKIEARQIETGKKF